MISPQARGIAFIAAMIGAMLAQNSTLMVIGWIGLLLNLAWAGILNRHVRFGVYILLPISIALILVWGVVVGAPPGQPMGSDPSGGIQYAESVALRLALLSGIGQLCFLTIPEYLLPLTFRRWGFKGHSLIIALGTMSIFPEMSQRADQVLTARFARGLAANRHFFTKLCQLPYLLRPLLAWSLRSAIQRSEYWHQRQLLREVDAMPLVTFRESRLIGFVYVAVSMLWMGLNGWVRWKASF